MPSPQPVLFLMLPGRRSMGRNVPFSLPMFLKAMCPHEVYPDVHLTFGLRLISLCFGSQLRGDVRWKMGRFHPRMIVLIVYLKKKKTTAFISVLCLPSCSGGMLFYPVQGAQTFPAGNIKIYRRINILLCLKIYMSKWKGKQEHWKNMALSRADHWKGVRMKFYWEETLKTWNHKKVFLHTAIASLYLSTVIFHCLVVPLCVYLHLNQPSLWWRTALHVSRLAWKASLQNYWVPECVG